MKHFFLSAVLTVSAVRFAEAAEPFAPGFKKVFVIVLENADYKEALAQPYLAALAQRGALLTDYHAVAHPSQPNYVAMIAGSTLKTDGDEKINFSTSTRHLGDLLEAKGLGWAAYAEDYPGNCSRKMHAGLYARKHAPFISFRNVQLNSERCARIKPASALDADLAAGGLPEFTLYTPNLDNDGHDTGVKFAAQWLEKAFGPRFDDPKFMKDLLVVITFDEDGGTKSNRIYTVLLGAGVKPGAEVAARYDHYSLLKTVESAFGLGDLGRHDASAAPIEGAWIQEKNDEPVSRMRP